MRMHASEQTRRVVVGVIRLTAACGGSLALLLVSGLFASPVRAASPVALPPAVADPGAKARVETMLGRLPVYFIENRGQEDPRVAYYVPGRNVTTYFAADGVTFAFSNPRLPSSPKTLGRPAALASEPMTRERWALKLDFVGARPAVVPRGQELTSTVISYFKGPESEWKAGLRTYASLIYPDLWPGIDLVYGGTPGRLKYTLLVKPGADPGQIKLAYRGASAVVLDRGRLEVSTPMGGFSEERPYVYQEVNGRRTEIPTRYALAAGQHTYGFDVGAYDRSRPLVLDPSFLVYAGYIGGAGFDIADAIAVDSAGNAYVVGTTVSTVPSFPGTVGPDLTQNGDFDAFVAKVKPDGSGLVYAGYIGGSSFDEAHAVAVDSGGNAYLAGFTSSTQTTFPKKVGPGLVYNGGASDAFVAKVKPDGTGLVYAGYIGGAGDDGALGIAVDSAGNAYITGRTDSDETTFPVKGGPGLTNSGGIFDAFVAKIKADGTGLVYAGYIGGAGNDVAFDIAVNSAGNAYVAGQTDSDQTTFPVKVGPDLSFNGGTSDGFVAKVKADGTGLIYLGYIGGADRDEAHGIALDAAGSAYLVGNTKSNETTFPVKVGPDLTLNSNPNSGDTNTFVAKVKADGTGLTYAGYIGVSDPNSHSAIAVDSTGSAYVAGTTSAQTGFPVRVGPDVFYGGGAFDAFVAKVKADGSGLLYSGYIGGAAQDFANGIAVDSAGNAYVAGTTFTDQTTFPVFVGPDLTFNNSSGSFVPDTFVVKVSGKPDLAEGALSIPGSVKPGSSFLVISTVVNEGLGTAPASTTRYYLSADDSKSGGDILLSGSKAVPSLVPGAIVSGSATLTIPASTPLGSYFVLACADDLHAVTELDESFNCGASFDTIQVTLPDLRETAVSSPPANASTGQSFSVTDTVQNFGSVAAGSSTTRYYLSTDTVKNSGDVLLTGSRAVASLNGGQASTGTVTVTIPSSTAPGTYRLLACADDLNVVNETNQNNNCRASTGAVTLSGTGTFDLSPTDATVVADELLVYRFEWVHPNVWSDLATLQLRFVDTTDGSIIFWVLWDQTSNTFSLVNDTGAPVGRAVGPGSDEILQTANAILHLDQTTVVPGGPTAPDVTLTLAMTFKSEAAGQDHRDYRVEVLGTDDLGQRQGFDQAGSLRVERTAPAPATLEGSATAVGTGTDSASIRLQGQFTAAGTLSLDQATLTLESLLDEVGGAGELVKGGGGAALLPLLLAARAGGKPTDAIYQTPSGVRPVVRAEMKVRDPKTGLVEFSVKVDRATVPVGPALCSGASPAATKLRTSLSLRDNSGASGGLDLTLAWRCLGTELKTP
jgi:CARDB protein/beta-propeller repeat-containing protein